MTRTLLLCVAVSLPAMAWAQAPSTCDTDRAVLIQYGTKLQQVRDALELELAKAEAAKQQAIAEKAALQKQLDELKSKGGHP